MMQNTYILFVVLLSFNIFVDAGNSPCERLVRGKSSQRFGTSGLLVVKQDKTAINIQNDWVYPSIEDTTWKDICFQQTAPCGLYENGTITSSCPSFSLQFDAIDCIFWGVCGILSSNKSILCFTTFQYNTEVSKAADGPYSKLKTNYYGLVYALGTDQQIYSFDSNLGDVPAGITFDSISSSLFYACGLDTDGYAQCWGPSNENSAQNVSKDLRFHQIEVSGSDSGTNSVTCGIVKSDTPSLNGTIYCTDRDWLVPPPTANGFIDIVSVEQDFCATNGETIYCWGTKGNVPMGLDFYCNTPTSTAIVNPTFEIPTALSPYIELKNPAAYLPVSKENHWRFDFDVIAFGSNDTVVGNYDSPFANLGFNGYLTQVLYLTEGNYTLSNKEAGQRRTLGSYVFQRVYLYSKEYNITIEELRRVNGSQPFTAKLFPFQITKAGYYTLGFSGQNFCMGDCVNIYLDDIFLYKGDPDSSTMLTSSNGVTSTRTGETSGMTTPSTADTTASATNSPTTTGNAPPPTDETETSQSVSVSSFYSLAITVMFTLLSFLFV